MNKKEIVSKFLKEGYQLDGDALCFFSENQKAIGTFFENVKKHPETTHTTLTLNYVSAMVGQPEPRTKDVGTTGSLGGVAVKRAHLHGEKEKIGVEEYTILYNKHYEDMKEMLLEKMVDLGVTSINKIQKQPEISLIVMVREKDRVDRLLVAEDPTGDITIQVPESASSEMRKEFDSVIEDDVFGVVCERSQTGLNIKQTIWPDIPLNREIAKTENDVKCLFLSGPIIPSKPGDVANKQLSGWLNKTKFKKILIFILGGRDADMEYINGAFGKPTKPNHEIILCRDDEIVVVSIGGVKVMVTPNTLMDSYRKAWPGASDVDVVVNILKRRSLIIAGLPEKLGAIPDIVSVQSSGEPLTLNYKGTTIISTPPFMETPTSWLLGLRSRETNKLDFS